MDLKKFSKLIMVEQTLFALPFAYIGILLAGGGTVSQWIWASVAIFAARTAGMSFNRVLDAKIDGENPRTEDRLIPSGELPKSSVWSVAIVSSVLLVFSAYMLNSLVFYLSFFAIFLLFTYSLFKRFSSSSHFYLGFVEAAAPIGGYLAISGKIQYEAILPGLAIMLWIAGLDILYSIQDAEFDKGAGLHSIPSKYGVEFAYKLSSISYISSILILVIMGFVGGFSFVYYISLVIVLFIYVKQQIIARGDIEDIESNMGKVFGLNRYISPIVFFGMVLDYLLR